MAHRDRPDVGPDRDLVHGDTTATVRKWLLGIRDHYITLDHCRELGVPIESARYVVTQLHERVLAGQRVIAR